MSTTTKVEGPPKSFHDVLQKYRSWEPAPLGTGKTEFTPEEKKQAEEKEEKRKQQLQDDINAILQKNTQYFRVCVVMIVVLFAVAVIVVLKNLNNPDLVKIAMGASGGTAVLLIRWMIHLWLHKNSLEILLRLARHLGGKTLKLVIENLAKEY